MAKFVSSFSGERTFREVRGRSTVRVEPKPESKSEPKPEVKRPEKVAERATEKWQALKIFLRECALEGDVVAAGSYKILNANEYEWGEETGRKIVSGIASILGATMSREEKEEEKSYELTKKEIPTKEKIAQKLSSLVLAGDEETREMGLLALESLGKMEGVDAGMLTQWAGAENAKLLAADVLQCALDSGIEI